MLLVISILGAPVCTLFVFLAIAERIGPLTMFQHQSAARDTPQPPLVHDGVLGHINATFEPSAHAQLAFGNPLELLGEDKAAAAKQWLEAFLKDFYTENSVFDPHLFASLCTKIQILCSDGAPSERRMGFLAVMVVFPKIAMIIRDPAHAVRIAASKPLRM